MMTESELSSPTCSSSSGDLSPKKMDDKTSYRKSNKPMMEKKRRARINSCLSQLKSLVLQAMKKDNSQYSKLEKADILELTVKHLKNVQRYQATSMTQVPDAMSKYRAGFNECANEVMRYLGESQGVNDDARTRILSHLATILSPINALPLQQTHTPILPAPSPMQQQQQQQQQQQHLQQLQFQQQHHHQQQQSLFLAPSNQQLSMDTNNNKPSVSHPAFLAPAGGAIDIKNVISGSPTAFQSPIASGISAPVGLQIPSIATQLQLVPSTLPSGQVALVLAPQAVPTMNMYTAPQGSREQGHEALKVGHETVNNQPHHVTKMEEAKARLTSNESPVAMVTKPSRSHRLDNTASATGAHQRSVTPYQCRLAVDLQTSSSSLSSSSSLCPSSSSAQSILRHADAVGMTSVPRTASTSIIISNSSSSNLNGNAGIVKATSTWRPW